MPVYEAWWDPEGEGVESFACGTADRMREEREKGRLGPNSTLLYSFEAGTFEEAQAIHNLRMGWGPYKPLGDVERCPDCEAWYYPGGSGECWRCNSRDKTKTDSR
jgi:hypothetical protein